MGMIDDDLLPLTADPPALPDKLSYQSLDIEAERRELEQVYRDLKAQLKAPLRDNTAIAEAKHKAELAKWLLSKLLPHWFGDKIEINNNIKVVPTVQIIIEQNRGVIVNAGPASSASSPRTDPLKIFPDSKTIPHESPK